MGDSDQPQHRPPLPSLQSTQAMGSGRLEPPPLLYTDSPKIPPSPSNEDETFTQTSQATNASNDRFSTSSLGTGIIRPQKNGADARQENKDSTGELEMGQMLDDLDQELGMTTRSESSVLAAPAASFSSAAAVPLAELGAAAKSRFAKVIHSSKAVSNSMLQ